VNRFKMRAITLHHPWTWAITVVGKDLENRDWQPYRANLTHLAIHGGAIPTLRGQVRRVHFAFEWIAQRFPDHPEVQRVAAMPLEVDRFRAIVKPGICAVFPWRGVVESSSSLWFTGKYGWRLEDGLILPSPIAATGHQGLWPVPEPQQTEIVRMLHAARNPNPLFGGER
jgi:hypothetical protein